MLNRVTFPLTTAQICDFILEKEYTDFLTLQQVINELLQSNMMTATHINNRTHLEITQEGRDTLRYFGNRISIDIRQDIDHYFNEKEYELRNEVSILSDYYRSTSGELEVKLVAKERDTDLISITLSVPTEELASSVCCNWQKKNKDIYQHLIRELFE